MTKLRARLGVQTMVSLAELKMFVRDEQTASDELIKRLKRHLHAPDEDPVAIHAARFGLSGQLSSSLKRL